MLQRSCFAPKRHLQRTSTRCKYRPTVSPGRPLFLSSQRPSQHATQAIALEPAPAASCHQGGLEHSTDEASRPSTPNKLSRIIDALAARQPPSQILQSIKESNELSSLFSDRENMKRLVVDLAQSSSFLHSLDILKLAYELGYTLPEQTYDSVCFHLSIEQRWDMILNLHDCAKDASLTSVGLLNWRAVALLQTRQYSVLQNILEEFRSAKLFPNQKTYHLMLSAYIQSNNMDGAKQCFQDMEEAGFSPNGTTHGLIAHYHRQFAADAELTRNSLAALHELPERGRLKVVNNLIQSSLETKNFLGTLQLLSMFHPFGVQELVALISNEVGDTQHELPEMVCSIPPHSLKADGDTFVKFMNHHIRNHNFDEAIRLWKSVASKGLRATPSVVVSLIHASFLAGRGNTAIRMVAGISAPSTAHTFNSLMIGFDKEKDNLQLNLSRPVLTTRMCNALLRGILQRQGLAQVPDLFEVMSSNGLKPNDQTLDLLMRHVNRIEEPLPKHLFQLLLNLAPSMGPSLNYLHHLYSCILRSGKRRFVDSAWKKSYLQGTRRKKNWTPSQVLLGDAKQFDPTAGIEFGTHSSYSEQAQEVVKSLAVQGVKSDSAMIFLRMRWDAIVQLDVGSAHRVFRSLVARGLRPNHHHFNALLEGYALSGDFTAANEVMAAAEQAGVEPNVVMYTTLIAAHARYRDPMSAMRVFRKMVALRISPDVPAIDALISAFYADGQLEVGRRLLLSLWSSIQPIPDDIQDEDLSTLITRFRTLHPSRSKGRKLEAPVRYSMANHVKRLSRTRALVFGPVLGIARFRHVRNRQKKLS